MQQPKTPCSYAEQFQFAGHYKVDLSWTCPSSTAVLAFKTDLFQKISSVLLPCCLQLNTELSIRKATCLALGTCNCCSKTVHSHPEDGQVNWCRVDISPDPLKKKVKTVVGFSITINKKNLLTRKTLWLWHSYRKIWSWR